MIKKKRAEKTKKSQIHNNDIAEEKTNEVTLVNQIPESQLQQNGNTEMQNVKDKKITEERSQINDYQNNTEMIQSSVIVKTKKKKYKKVKKVKKVKKNQTINDVSIQNEIIKTIQAKEKNEKDGEDHFLSDIELNEIEQQIDVQQNEKAVELTQDKFNKKISQTQEQFSNKLLEGETEQKANISNQKSVDQLILDQLQQNVNLPQQETIDKLILEQFPQQLNQSQLEVKRASFLKQDKYGTQEAIVIKESNMFQDYQENLDSQGSQQQKEKRIRFQPLSAEEQQMRVQINAGNQSSEDDSSEYTYEEVIDSNQSVDYKPNLAFNRHNQHRLEKKKADLQLKIEGDKINIISMLKDQQKLIQSKGSSYLET